MVDGMGGDDDDGGSGEDELSMVAASSLSRYETGTRFCSAPECSF